MASGNGTGTETLNGADGGVVTPEQFDAMTDASEVPSGPGVRKPHEAKQPVYGNAARQQAQRAAAPAAEVPPMQLMPVDPAQAQAAREDLYARAQVPAALRPIFNQLTPQEIMFVVAHVEHAYRSGVATTEQAAAAGGACGHAPVMECYNEVIAGYMKAVSFLDPDSDDPTVIKCLRMANKAYDRLAAGAIG
jgi:hypothetical protein